MDAPFKGRISNNETKALAVKCFAMPRCRLCHMSVLKNDQCSVCSNGTPVKIGGVSCQAFWQPSVASHNGCPDTSSNGTSGFSCPALHIQQIPSQDFLLEAALGTLEKVWSILPMRASAGRSPFVPRWQQRMVTVPSALDTPELNNSAMSCA